MLQINHMPELYDGTVVHENQGTVNGFESSGQTMNCSECEYNNTIKPLLICKEAMNRT